MAPTQTQATPTDTSLRSDANVWPKFTYDDPHAMRRWLASLGFDEGVLVLDDDGETVRHSEMLWPEGGRVMVSSRGTQDRTFESGRGASGCYVVTEEPDAVHERALRLGAEVIRGLEDTDYGSRGFSLRDPEGNTWSFGTYAGSVG